VGEATEARFSRNVKFLAEGENRAVVTFSEKFLFVNVSDVIEAEAAGPSAA